jgi:RibD C-terminal domain
VSATLANPAWNNSTVLKGDVLNEVSALKQHIDGDIVIAGSFQLVRTLIEHDLVDELRLKIFPVAPGAGERLFAETSDNKPMRLRHPDPRGRDRLPHLPICPGRLAASDGASVPKCFTSGTFSPSFAYRTGLRSPR